MGRNENDVNNDSQKQWQARAKSVAWHVNTGWWLHFLLLPTLAISVLFSALILIARSQGWAARPFAIAGAALLFVSTIIVFLIARRKFFRVDDALVRIESNARLNNRLTSAAAGVGDWPEFDAKADAGLKWNFKRILIPLGVAMLCLAGSVLIPIKLTAEAATHDMQEPSAWTQTQQWMDALKHEDIVQPKELDAIKEQLEALRKQPKEDWYSHNSLEAGDQLRDQTRQGIQEFDRNLALADSVLNQLMKAQAEMNGADGKDAKSANGDNNKSANGENGEKKNGDPKDPGGLDKATQEALQKQLQKAIEGLKSGSLKLDPKMLSSLSKIDPSKLKMIDPKQLKECKSCTGKGTNACAKCTGKGGKDAALAMLVESMTTASCNKPGMGAPTRGRGDAPLTFNKDEEKTALNGQEGLSNPNMENASIGDTIAVKDTAHHVDPSDFKGAQSGGSAQAGGAGEAVWKTEVLPEEQAALERYFSEKK